MIRKAVAALFLVPLGFLVACDGDVTVEGPSPTPTEPVSILIGGQCRAFGSSIECEDDSRSVPADQLTSVSWSLRDAATGISIDSKPGQPSGEIAFSGLAEGAYSVEQTVVAADGSSDHQVHGNLSISL